MPTNTTQTRELEPQAIEDERERCARVAFGKLREEDIERSLEQRIIDGTHNTACLEIYAAIRRDDTADTEGEG